MDSIDNVWCGGEEWCPVTVTAGLIGKKWHPVIISRLIVKEDLGFADLQEMIPEISSKVLSDALQDLDKKGLVEREIVNEQPFRVSYSLTEQGESLEPIIEEMNDWGSEYLESMSQAPSEIA